MLGNRFSSLPIAQFCAKAPTLDSGAGRAAAVSSCYHARCAGDDKWRDMYARLTAEEQSECDSMKQPSVVRLQHGVELHYADAHKEVPLGLDDDMTFLPKGHPRCITEGTADFYWFRDGVVYGADLKRSEWTSEPHSLQVVGYNLAIVAMLAADGHTVNGFVPGIFAATEGLWSWGDYCEVGSAKYAEWCAKVRAAALHTTDEYNRGPHCRGCYSRKQCGAYLVDPRSAADGISKFLTGELDAPRALELIELVERAEAMCATARTLYQAFADVSGGIRDGNGKVYGPVKCAGRYTLDKKALESEHPELVQKFYKQGPSYCQYRWTKDKSAP